MIEQPNELKKLAAIAGDLGLSSDLRIKSIELIGDIGTHDAFLALLDLVASQKLVKEERELVLKHTREIPKSGR